ncbi:glycosyltransferase family 1 protein [Kiritimatiellaeota bacterium B1221]|nr:glycosyltransferase family 1 protein [Kiritimatiellaeota bacterium B1221]
MERVVERFTSGFSEEIDWRVCVLPYPRTHPVDWIRNGLYARKKKADVYHISGESHFLSIFLPRKKTILTVHDCIVLDKLSGVKQFLMRWGFFALPSWWVGTVTTISQASLEELRKWTKLRLKNAVVIPDPLPFDVDCTKLKQPSDSELVFLTIGTKANKNIERCIEAASGLSCKLLLIGRLTPSMINSLESLKIEYENRYDLSDEELLQSYRDADCLLFPSLAEGFGMPILEAQAMGIPVITSNCSSMPEVGGEGALYVEPTSVESIRKSIKDILSDQELVKRLCKEGNENVGRFLPHSVARQYIELYQKIETDEEVV